MSEHESHDEEDNEKRERVSIMIDASSSSPASSPPFHSVIGDVIRRGRDKDDGDDENAFPIVNHGADERRGSGRVDNALEATRHAPCNNEASSSSSSSSSTTTKKKSSEKREKSTSSQHRREAVEESPTLSRRQRAKSCAPAPRSRSRSKSRAPSSSSSRKRLDRDGDKSREKTQRSKKRPVQSSSGSAKKSGRGLGSRVTSSASDFGIFCDITPATPDARAE
jgi:hypothetical protein